MLTKGKLLPILLSLLVVLIIAASVVVAKTSKRPKVIYVDRNTEYDPQLLTMGMRISKFGGMSIYRDSPGVLLTQSKKLELTAEQEQRLDEIVHEARRQAVSVLTEEQIAKISPIPTEPFVIAELDRVIPLATCSTSSHDSCTVEGHVH